MIAKLALVPFVIINLTRLTAGVCMKVRFKSKVTRGLIGSSRRFAALSRLSRGSLAAQEKPLGPGWLMTRDIFQLSRFVTLHLPL